MEDEVSLTILLIFIQWGKKISSRPLKEGLVTFIALFKKSVAI